MKHIICFHLLNDYSGSPKVLFHTLQKALDLGYRVDLVSSSGGILDALSSSSSGHFRKFSYPYRFSRYPAITIARYACVQLYYFLLSFRYLFRRDIVFLINTLLPVGAALGGWLTGKCVLYYYHEDAIAKGCVYRILSRCMQQLATGVICVSAYQRSSLKRTEKVSVVPNGLPVGFVQRLSVEPLQAYRRQTVLMIASLKRYKGIQEFVWLAAQLSQYTFQLVLNAKQHEIEAFMYQYEVVRPANLHIYDRQSDIVPFLCRSSVLVNLSHPNLFQETFGLTALEAMSAGLPVIVPVTGGISELVRDGVNGYKTDVRQLDKIAEQLTHLLSDENLYEQMAINAWNYSKQFDVERTTTTVLSIVATS
ncbi:MAG: glycosyltransferase family 4 protein [Prevotellaceae bacterium]|jgi:glycosyltransferase involved in cell wall biosynthesis|nr:glycosyltransferase family 4 protein [Prevotellaceae bacterium]